MITALASSGMAQSSLASPADAVSPDTPALITFTSCPRAFNARSSWAGKESFSGRPSPAVRLSPKATITGVAAAA